MLGRRDFVDYTDSENGHTDALINVSECTEEHEPVAISSKSDHQSGIETERLVIE